MLEAREAETMLRLMAEQSPEHALAFLDLEGRALVIDADTVVGADWNRLFVGFLRRKFGDDAFAVERVEDAPDDPARGAQPASSVA